MIFMLHGMVCLAGGGDVLQFVFMVYLLFLDMLFVGACSLQRGTSVVIGTQVVNMSLCWQFSSRSALGPLHLPCQQACLLAARQG